MQPAKEQSLNPVSEQMIPSFPGFLESLNSSRSSGKTQQTEPSSDVSTNTSTKNEGLETYGDKTIRDIKLQPQDHDNHQHCRSETRQKNTW